MADLEGPLSAAEQQELTGLLAEWLPEQRWFAGKGHELTRVTVVAMTELRPSDDDADTSLEGRLTAAVESTLARVIDLRGLPQVIHLVVGVLLDGEDWQTYQVPLSIYPAAADAPAGDRTLVGLMADGRAVVDTLTDPMGMTALMQKPSDAPVLDPGETHGRAPTAGATRPPSFEAMRTDPAWSRIPPRRLDVEQSNTSIVVGETALAKVFRRLAPGKNPDIEVHVALQGNPHLGRCLGWVNGGWYDPDTEQWCAGHLAMLQQLLSPAADGWDLACQRVAADESFAAEARALGAATAVVHDELRAVFPTQRLVGADVGPLVARLVSRLEEAASLVPEVGELLEPLRRRVEALSTVTGVVEVQRVHGDYHLGQVLLAADGWKLLDFEGEPGADVAARTAADHALRDVAGMLRSFAYAGAQGGAQRAAEEVTAWRDACERAFLAGYSAGATGPGEASGAAAELTADERTILTAYLVDKAAYEAVYEKRYRPDWLEIPLAFLATLASEE